MPIYVAEGLSFLPPTLTADYAPRRSSAKATLTEILVADLGDMTSKTPHLIVGSHYSFVRPKLIRIRCGLLVMT